MASPSRARSPQHSCALRALSLSHSVLLQTPIEFVLGLAPGDPGYEDVEATVVAEAERLASFDHLHVVKCLGFGVLPGKPPYLIMERALSSLDALVVSDEATGSTTVSRVQLWGLMRDVLDGCAHIHSRSFFLRDVKPDNVLVFPALGGRLIAKIADVGLSKLGVVTATKEAGAVLPSS